MYTYTTMYMPLAEVVVPLQQRVAQQRHQNALYMCVCMCIYKYVFAVSISASRGCTIYMCVCMCIYNYVYDIVPVVAEVVVP